MVLFFGFCLSSGSLSSAEVIEIPSKPDDANIKILAVLNKIDPDGFEVDPRTSGFNYKYVDSTSSPFDFKIFIGKMSQNSVDSIIRIESKDRGQEKVWKQVLEAELLSKPDSPSARKLDRKSFFISQGLNLIQPSLSVGYNSYDSPFYNGRDTFWASSIYFLVDLVLITGAYVYTKDKAPRKTLWDNLLNRPGAPELHKGPDALTILGALAVTRLYRAVGSYQDTAAHNKMAEFSYTFTF